MSLNGVGLTSRPQTLPADQYDHEISLIDATKPTRASTLDAPDDLSGPSDISSRRASGARLSKRWTKGTLREELVRRKYSKWQEGRVNNNEDTEDSSDEGANVTARRNDETSDAGPTAQTAVAGEPIQDAQGRKQRLQDIATSKCHAKGIKAVKDDYVVDILYENQRGSFWCGIPLYSHKSLLNFDPSPWQSAFFKDSPVNITNAQVPDPSWEWAWKSWYVDMSQDVDEEGWQYSFSFRQGFAWHGTHPWFHSFCRRRRWLRKRVKKHSNRRRETNGGTSQAHMLTADYFTIHARRDHSRGSSAERTVNARSSFTDYNGDQTEDEETLEDLSDITSLMRALKKGPVDRAKLAAVKRFLIQGGEDVFYLAEKMPDIMSSFIFQNSRRQLLAHLLYVCNAASEHRVEHVNRHKPEDDVEKRRIDSLLKAVHAAEEQVNGLEYWSDVKEMAEKGERQTGVDEGQSCRGLHGSDPELKKGSKDKGAAKAAMPETEIKGIPDEADVVQGRGVDGDPSQRSKENYKSAVETSPATAEPASAPVPAEKNKVEGVRDGNAIRRGGTASEYQETSSTTSESLKASFIAPHPAATATSNIIGQSWGRPTQPLSHDDSVSLQKYHQSVSKTVANGDDTSSLNQTVLSGESAIDDVTTSDPEDVPLARIVRAARSRRKHLADKESIRLQLEDKSMLSFDWRKPLEILEKHTHVGKVDDDLVGERFLVREEIIQAFAGDIGETIWDIKYRSGCEVHVLGKETRIGKYRSVLLQGSPSSIEMAKETMLSLFRRRLPDGTTFDSDRFLFGAAAGEVEEAGQSPVRKVWLKNARSLHQIRADKIPRPIIWTTLSFAKHVEDLTDSTVSRLMHRHLYKGKDSHVVMVAQLLRNLFHNPLNDNIISVRAFNAALKFLYKHNMISTARTLFGRMESLRRRMTSETFNIMLRGVAARKDLHNFTFLLRLMVRRGIKPNPGTWVALVMAVPSRAVQMRIEASMRRKGLLDNPDTVKDVMALGISDELTGHLSSGQGVQSFIERIDEAYSPAWISQSSLNQILDKIGERGSFSTALETLELVHDRGIQPDTKTLNTLISHCHRQGNLNEAVRLVQHFQLRFLVRPDEITYHILFVLAWKCQQYNVCRTVWRHGCLKAAVSHKMQEQVLRSLIRNTPTQPKTKGEMWMTSAGKVIAGIAPDEGIMERLIGWSEQGAQRCENLALAKEMLAQDLAALRSYRSAQPLVYQLRDALALDRSWAHNHVRKNTSTIWKVENAINIRLVRR
ncbi:MAG: hypothetical protein M1830_000018 [Pleopsidium flavum]|nr:MAG: hypothetical protein M1830_000018 [Pleopsidium flavum]